MGIGIALASGLVKGFTGNIGREMERRQAERTRLDTIENAVLTSGLGDDFNNKNVAAIKSMLSSAREQDAQRGGIDLFGTRGEELIPDTAMADLIGKLKTTAKTDDDDPKIVSFIGQGDYRYDFYTDVKKAANPNEAMGNITTLVAEIQKNPDKFKNAPESVHLDFEQIIRANAGIIQRDNYFKTGEFDVDLPEMNGVLRSTQMFDDVYNVLYPDQERQSTFGDQYVIMNDGVESATPSKNVEADGNVIGFEIMKPKSDAHAKAQTTVMNNFGANTDNYAATWVGYTDILTGYNKADRERLFDATINFGAKYELFGPTSSTTFANLNKDTANEMLKDLNELADGDLVEMSFILGAYQKPQQFETQSRPKAGGIPGTGGTPAKPVATAKLHAARVLISSTATEDDFQKILDSNVALEAVLSETTGLVALRNMADEFTTLPVVSRYAGAVSRAKNVLGFFFDSDDEGDAVSRGAITSVAPDTQIVSSRRAGELGFDNATGESRTDDSKKYMTTEYIEGLNAGIEQRRKDGMAVAEKDRLLKKDGTRMTAEEMGIMYARFESLRISLAFQMARAADPSGRLSNQDIIQQLARLGEELDTPEQMKARIQYAIDDFTRQKNRYAHMAKYADSTGPVTSVEKQQIQGHHSVTMLARAAGFQTASESMSVAPGDQPEPPVYSMKNNAGTVSYGGQTYMLAGNGKVYDSTTMQIITDMDLLSLILSAPGIPQNYMPPQSQSADVSVPSGQGT